MRFFTAVALLSIVTFLPLKAQAQDGQITVELNKFEPADTAPGCKTFFLFRNDTGKAFEGLELSLAILNGQGVIDQLLTIDAAPLPLGRTTLKLFEIPQIGCSDISEILLHEVPACKPQNEDPVDCFDILNLVSRTSAGLVN